MISRANRFHGYNSLRYVYTRGQTVRGPLITIKYVANEKRKIYRCAVVVSKKVSKSAVVRNRIRRRIYEQIRLLSIQKPYDIVATVYSDQVAEIPTSELANKIKVHLKTAGIV
jgi:ribonuclease P protein component